MRLCPSGNYLSIFPHRWIECTNWALGLGPSRIETLSWNLLRESRLVSTLPSFLFPVKNKKKKEKNGPLTFSVSQSPKKKRAKLFFFLSQLANYESREQVVWALSTETALFYIVSSFVVFKVSYASFRFCSSLKLEVFFSSGQYKKLRSFCLPFFYN